MFSKFFIERPKFAFVVSIVITIAGLVAMGALPIALYPELAPPQVQSLPALLLLLLGALLIA